MTDSLLHNHFPELRDRLGRLQLGAAPTPVRVLDLGTRNRVWCKDEGCYGTGGWGGNKVRKLEWLLPEIRRSGAHTILTVGGTGTNWGLATALYAREHGLRTALALIDQPMDDQVRAQLRRLEKSGAALHFTHDKLRTILAAPWLMARHASLHGLPYYVPAGGSSPIGVLGYVETALELAAQVAEGALPEPGHVVTAAGSGGTAAGLALGLRLAGLRTRVIGVVVNDTLPLRSQNIVTLANRTAALLRSRGIRDHIPTLASDSVTMLRNWLGPGYGHETPAARAALTRAADIGLELETVYTAKALAALLDLESVGGFGTEPVLFLNTYGPRESA